MIARTLALAATALAVAAAPAQAAQSFDLSGRVGAPNTSGTKLVQTGTFTSARLGPGSITVTTDLDPFLDSLPVELR